MKIVAPLQEYACFWEMRFSLFFKTHSPKTHTRKLRFSLFRFAVAVSFLLSLLLPPAPRPVERHVMSCHTHVPWLMTRDSWIMTRDSWLMTLPFRSQKTYLPAEFESYLTWRPRHKKTKLLTLERKVLDLSLQLRNPELPKCLSKLATRPFLLMRAPCKGPTGTHAQKAHAPLFSRAEQYALFHLLCVANDRGTNR